MKKVQFSSTNLMYSPLPWSPELDPDPDAVQLPPSPFLSHATFLHAPPPESADEPPAEPGPGPQPERASPILRGAPAPAPSWTPPDIYSPWSWPAAVLQDAKTPPGLPPGALPPPQPVLYAPWATPSRWPPPSPSPPPLYTAWPCQPSPPYPSTYTPAPSAPQLHVLLAFSPFSPPAVTYDVAHPPHTLNAQLTPSFLEPATHPPRAALVLRCRRLPFADDWTIKIAPSHPAGVVCVLDVLRAVYGALRTAVRRAEYDSLGVDGARQRVDAAYFARCRMLAGEEERQVEELKGVKRVDFLCGKTRFLGLSGPLAPDGAGVWELNVSD